MTARTGTTTTSGDVAVFAPSTRTRGGVVTGSLNIPPTTTDVAVFYPSSRMRNGVWTRLFNTSSLPDLECPMSIVPVLLNTATKISVYMRDASTGVGRAGLTLTINQKKSSASSFSVITPAVTDVGGGWYDLALLAGHVDTIGKTPLSISAPNASSRNDVCLDVISYDLFSTAIVTPPTPPTAAAIRDAILDAARSGHLGVGTIGEGVAIAASMLQGNFYMDNVVNTDPNGQTSARIRCFLSGTATAGATQGGSGEGEFATFVVTTTYSAPGKATSHRAVQQ